MRNSIYRRVLMLLSVVLVLTAMFTLTSYADKKIDLPTYKNTYDSANAAAGGWELLAPTYKDGKVKLQFPGGTEVGVEDSVSRFKVVPDETQLVLHIPEADQVAIKDYNGISFYRRISNGYYFAHVPGAKYAFVLTTDDGQTIRAEYYWNMNGVTANGMEIVDTDIAYKIAALEDNPKLAKITFIPYVDGDFFNIYSGDRYYIADDPATEDVDETKAGTYYYVLLKYFTLLETAEIPVLSAEKDTWDGTDADAHDGKIIGLDAAKMYKYAPVHSFDADFVTVTGKTEITGLVGGVYEVVGVEEGKNDSAKVIVVVPKDTQGTLSYVEGDWGANTVKKMSDVPISGYFTSSFKEPYPSDANNFHLASLFMRGGFNGTYTVEKDDDSWYKCIVPTQAFAKAYREDFTKLSYVLKPEEQFDVDAAELYTDLYYYGMPVDDLTKGISYAIKIYTNGDTENPAIFVNPWWDSTSKKVVMDSVSNAREQLDGYVTRIDILHCYVLPEGQAVNNSSAQGYNMLDSLQSRPFTTLTVPELTVSATDKEGVYKLTGFDATRTYAWSSNGKDYTTFSGSSELSNLAIGTYYIKSIAMNSSENDSAPVAIEIKGAAEFVGELTANGSTISGLSADAKYQYAKVDHFGFGEWTAIEAGTTELAGVANGLYAFCVIGENGYGNSAENFVLVGDGNANQTRLMYLAEDGDNAGRYVGDIDNTGRPFSKGYWGASEVNISLYYFGGDNDLSLLLGGGGFTLPTETEAAKETLSKIDLAYTMSDDQIVDIHQLGSLGVELRLQGTMGAWLFQNVDPSEHLTRVRIWVKGSDVDYYDVITNWAGNNVTTTIDFNQLLPDDAKGYVTALQIFQFGAFPDYFEVNTTATARLNYPCIRIRSYSLTNGEKAATPAVSLYANEDGTFGLTGLEANRSYKYSNDGGKTWTVTPAGATSVALTEYGEYLVVQRGYDVYSDSDAVTLVLNGKHEAMSGLSVEDGAIVGLNADKFYEYAAYNKLSLEWVQAEAGSTSISGLDAGLWAVRYTGENKIAGEPQYVFVEGSEDYGRVNYCGTDTMYTEYVLGAWTMAGSRTYLDSVDKNPRIASAFNGNYETRLEYTWRYALTSSQILPINDVDNFKVGFAYGNGFPWSAADIQARVRLHVVGGTQEYYDIFVNYIKEDFVLIDVEDVIPANAEGYLTAIEITPVYEILDLDKSGEVYNRYPCLYLDYILVNPEGTDTEKWVASLDLTDAPDGIEVVKDDLVYLINNYTLKGLDSTKTYQYQYNGNIWKDMESGITEFALTSTGKFFLRYAATATEEASGVVAFDIPLGTPAFVSNGVTAYKYGQGDYFRTDSWMSWPETITFDQERPVMRISTDKKLSDASFKYQFSEINRFVVDDNPYLSVDFNNNTYCGLANGLFENAIPLVNVYVEGSDTPYVVKGEWKGYDAADGFTPNLILVNLLDEFPDIAGKTIRAIEFRPYSNLDLTPGDYQIDGYVYFRLVHMGFFDTATNNNAVAWNSNKLRVNYPATEIRAESDVILPIGATADDAEVVVYEIFSDGNEFPIKNAEIIVPDDFATESGTYTVTAEWRGMSATSTVAVGLDSIRIESAPTKTAYIAGDKLDTTGLVVKAVLGDGSEVDISDKATLSVDIVTAGMTEVTVSYGGKTATFAITVEEVKITALEIASYPDKENAGGYEAGEAVDFTGLTIKAIYNNGTSKLVTFDELQVEYNAEVMTPNVPVKITYEGYTFEGFVPTVIEAVLVKININTPADKLTYLVGDQLDTTGLALELVYDNGVKETVTEGFTAEADLSVAGTATVIVTYEGVTVTYDVEVRGVEMMFISQSAEKLEYVVGDKLDTTGLLVFVVYSDGTEDEISEGFTVECDEFTAAGTYTVTVSIGGFSETYEVTVTAPAEPEEPEDIASGAIDGTDITWTIDADGVLTVSGTDTMPNYANTNSNRAPWYADRAKVTSIVVEEGMTSIGNFAFHNCSKATSITLPESLTTLTGASMIRGTAITEVDLSNVVVMTKNIFASATSVERVIFSEGFKDARGNIFGGNTLNITVVAPEDSYAYKYVDFFATKYAGQANLTAEANGVAECPIHVMGSIGEAAIYAFYKMDVDKNGNDVNWMVISGEGAVRSFWYISEARKAMDAEQGGNNFAPTYYMYEDTAFGRPILRNTKKLQVLEGITSIGNYSFYRCLKAQELEILGPIDRIGNAAFQACEAFRKIIVPDTVTAIGKNAFNGCKYLKTMTIPDSVTSIGETIFKNTGIEAGETRPSESATLTITTTNQLFIDYINTYYPTDTCKVVLK